MAGSSATPVEKKPANMTEAQALHVCRCFRNLVHRDVAQTLEDGTTCIVKVCPMEDTSQNMVAVESNLSGGVMVTEFQLPAQQANEFKAGDTTFLSISDHNRSQLFDYDNAEVPALFTAATSGTADFNQVVAEIGRRQARTTDHHEAQRLAALLASLVNLTKLGVCAINPIKGNCTYLWAMASTYVNKLGSPVSTGGADPVRTMTDLLNDTLVTAQRKIVRLDTVPKFFMAIHYYCVFSTVSGNYPLEVCNHFFSGAAYELMTVHGKSLWTSQEYVPI